MVPRPLSIFYDGFGHNAPFTGAEVRRGPCRGEDVVNAIIGFLAVSALAGLVLGLGLLERHPNELYFGLAAIVVSGLILAISAAAILQNLDFGSLEGIAIIVLCLTVNQIAYLIGATLASRAPKNATRSLT